MRRIRRPGRHQRTRYPARRTRHAAHANLRAGALLLLLLGGITACAKSPTDRPDGLPAGINDTFLSEDLDLEEYRGRFEGESRAVYAEREAITHALGLSPGDEIADVGAGTGFFSLLFAKAVGAKGRVFAVEISPRFLEALRKEVRPQAPDVLEVVAGTARSISLPENSLDAAFLCDVYHHFEHPNDSLASLRSALRPGGELFLIDFHRVPGESPAWLLEHVRAGREVFQAEIEASGFAWREDITLDGLDDNYFLRFENVK